MSQTLVKQYAGTIKINDKLNYRLGELDFAALDKDEATITVAELHDAITQLIKDNPKTLAMKVYTNWCPIVAVSLAQDCDEAGTLSLHLTRVP